MGKNRKGTAKNKELGRLLIKDKNNSRQKRVTVSGTDCWRHTSDLQDGYDWNRLNLQSVTEQDTLDEFLDTAEMAGVEFTAEKMNIKIVGATSGITGVLGEQEKSRIKDLQEKHKSLVTIPKRPSWDENTTPEQLEEMEKEAFLNWRRSLAMLQETSNLMLTPYEKNLAIWRQLWRVIERSDVVCQIVDARNPLLYKCDDLESYVKEVDQSKEFIVLINKADYLTEEQRKCWAEYFTEQNTKVIFWSALEELILDDELSTEVSEGASKNDNIEEFSESDDEVHDENDDQSEQGLVAQERTNTDEELDSDKNVDSVPTGLPENNSAVNSSNLFTRTALLRYFKTFNTNLSDKKSFATVGLVGYPNVGKSSTINALMQEKKTAVSATPGKTRHFQTHFLDEELCLCDCPGLVFPTFIFTKAHLVLNGILPVDQMREHNGPVELLIRHIPRKIIESTYGINIIVRPTGKEDPDRLPTAEELLSSYAKMRGFMTANGQPDCPRASRYILKDYLKGKLLYCHPPIGESGKSFKQSQVSNRVLERLIAKEAKEKKAIIKNANAKVDISSLKLSEIDDDFFSEKTPSAHYKVPTGTQGLQPEDESRHINKPWKKHYNRNKKEKLRRIHNEC